MKARSDIGMGNRPSEGLDQTVLLEVAWDQIAAPGTYVDTQTGDLYRIPSEGFAGQHSPIIVRETCSPALLRQLSEDPFLTTFQARILCAKNSLEMNF